MVEFIIENLSSTISIQSENSNELSIILLEKYFFNNVNDSKDMSLEIIRRFNLKENDINSSNQPVKTRNTINLTDYFAIPFLIIQRILDSIDGRGCVIGRIKLSYVLW